ncbi:MAG: NADP(H)-dependent aldo-keto reductase [Flavobacteriales bacterium]|nr:NADP(H)-dependent aldo-keto reductase [Flavobacteriia bacterium]NCP06547.1 NADP(H)-dependent aldo-keto reductase [Flavobacteriales bacterium]PIV93002.1 MAG: NADP(H)-dependent aldo-keto reductase [Flavobacteriaceae bacterium CG17_big_fil_post_rev_8_21_14_2_50_33_15]PIY12738.1 MAG: NADP(H)-dependent aldo-keto reductase [Flavobacteriaceae bacterium CG_4_10_14_3_um_filter_33_47]PJB18659.1 MAG: NADP(H)-dependent aldo-keto reductase [Flavobacteriaceae bacterium CG_4_9_14_3_um_filter_33_16]
MIYTKLPNTYIKVSKICLGTMTWGNQNTESEGHEQLDYAIEQGINFIDTAEMYPVPASPETQGRTSKIIGSWLKKSGKRDKVILASKIVGRPSDYTAHIRTTGLSSESIKEALDNELKRLQTDYIDLYQIHWPERITNTFGVRDYKPAPEDEWKDNFNEVLHALEEKIKSGKIRHIGISNEKAWGAMRYLAESKKGLPRMITIQNAYSLINRVFEGDMAEISIRENLGLLAYSPMAFGVLSGKYIKGTAADNARLKLFPRFARYSSEQCTEATKRYLKIAEENNMTLAQMSLAFVTQQPFVTSNIIGATSLEQLKENIDSIHINLSDDILKQINDVHAEIPNPAT